MKHDLMVVYFVPNLLNFVSAETYPGEHHNSYGWGCPGGQKDLEFIVVYFY